LKQKKEKKNQQIKRRNKIGMGIISFRKKQDADWLIIGLGNPGSEYKNTRHNIGYKSIDELHREWGVSSIKKNFIPPFFLLNLTI